VCQTCHAHFAIPFSCRGRSFCPSCEKKRQLLWAEWLRDTLLAPVPHRHVVFTMPRLLRPLFRKRRELLDELALAGAEALIEAIREGVGEVVRPGIVVSIATAGDLVQWHPHGHVLTTDGGFSADDEFHPMSAWDGERLMALFRRRLLDRLLARKAISQQLVSKLLCWRHPGFSSFLAEPIPFEDKRTLEDVACYLVRSPLSLKKLVYLDGQKAVLYRSRMNPSLGRNFEAMDPLEWLARLADHIPDPGKHRVHFYGHYASRVRGARAARAEPPTEIEDGSSATTNESERGEGVRRAGLALFTVSPRPTHSSVAAAAAS
jgi:Putative transposase/Transposase zinc-binding domain